MKKVLVLVLVMVFAFAFRVQAQDLKTPAHLRFATQNLGSAWYMYGANFSKLWRTVLPKGSTTVLPGRVFKGQDKEVSLVGFPTILIGHKEMKPEVVYVLTKTLVENKSELVKTHAGFKNFLPEESW